MIFLNDQLSKTLNSSPIEKTPPDSECVFFLADMSGFLYKSLFNLLEFQRLVLNYSPPLKVQDLPRNQKVRPL